jgi:hypothetical protein
LQLFHAAPNQYRPKFHILLTTFELARKEELVNLLRQRRVFFGALVVDEAHRLKGMNSQIWQAIQVLAPIQHRRESCELAQARQKNGPLSDGRTMHKLPRRACRNWYGLRSCWSDWAGVANRVASCVKSSWSRILSPECGGCDGCRSSSTSGRCCSRAHPSRTTCRCGEQRQQANTHPPPYHFFYQLTPPSFLRSSSRCCTSWTRTAGRTGTPSVASSAAARTAHRTPSRWVSATGLQP